MTELEQYIKSCFEVVNTDDLKTIVSLFNLTTIKKNDFLLKKGKRCDKLSFASCNFKIETEINNDFNL